MVAKTTDYYRRVARRIAALAAHRMADEKYSREYLVAYLGVIGARVLAERERGRRLLKLEGELTKQRREAWKMKDAIQEQAHFLREELLAARVRFKFAAERMENARQRNDDLIQAAAQRPKIVGAKGGAASAAVVRDVRAYAERLARERAPDGGWPSAPVAASEVMSEVNAYARTKGRKFAQRKVEEWLREAGIKRSAHTQ